MGTLRFQDIQERLPGIAASLLSDRLKALEENGVINREYYSKYPPRASYTLTEKGHELGLVVNALGRWGTRHLGAKMSKVVKHTECGHALELSHYCVHCEEPVRSNDVTVTERIVRKVKSSVDSGA